MTAQKIDRSPLMEALHQFDAVEANIAKLERLWDEIRALVPTGICFGPNPEYEQKCRSFDDILTTLPKIDGWKPDIQLLEYNEIAQNRFDAHECGMIEAEISIETAIDSPGQSIREYRHKFNKKRKALTRDVLDERINAFDADLRLLRQEIGEIEPSSKIENPLFDRLREHIAEIDVLLGSASRPTRWHDLRRHLGFGEGSDLRDIEKFDWPQVKAEVRKSLYGADDPLPISIPDLADLVAVKPKGKIITELSWSNLSAVDFERLIFTLISNEDGYENPEWLMRTNAPDKGRDLSVNRVSTDALTGIIRQRVIIQCKHWLTASINISELATLKEQMKLWNTPKVEVLIMATSGRFTADAVTWIEQHNSDGQMPRIEMWAESHLERLLASRPALIAEFNLR
ncbi:MAG: restriction endonuclease [Alphaproteobacteria bacterium]|nr:restriction endonuclease [Alphaproteobacteria bacterium]